MSTPTIRFYSLSQAAVYETCKGQISDGIWENSGPKDHWQIMCQAKSVVANIGEAVGPNFVPARKYGLMKCLEYSGQDMVNTVKVVTVFPKLLGTTCWSLPVAGETQNYINEVGATEAHTFSAEDITAIEAVPYTLDDARHDLSIVNKIVNGRDHEVVTAPVEKVAKVKVAAASHEGTKLTMKAINQYLASSGTLNRVQGANAEIFIVKGGKLVKTEVRRWNTLTLLQWFELAA